MINFYDEEEHLDKVGKNNHTVVIYGAPSSIATAIYERVLPQADFFIDRNAVDIGNIKNIPVITIEQFTTMFDCTGGGVDFVISNKSEKSQNEIVQLLIEIYKVCSFTINIFSFTMEYKKPVLTDLLKNPEYINALKDGYAHIEEAKNNFEEYINNLENIPRLQIVATSPTSLGFSEYTS